MRQAGGTALGVPVDVPDAKAVDDTAQKVADAVAPDCSTAVSRAPASTRSTTRTSRAER